MILQPIDFVVYTWLVVAVQSVAYVGWDLRSSGLPGDLNGRDVNGVGRVDDIEPASEAWQCYGQHKHRAYRVVSTLLERSGVVPPPSPSPLKYETVFLDRRSKLLEVYEIGVRKMLVNREHSIPSQNSIKGLDARVLVGNFTEYRHQNCEIELSFWKGKTSARITLSEANVVKSSRCEFLPSLSEHFTLHVEQFESPVRNSPCELDAEIAGAGTDFQNPASLGNREAISERFWSDKESSERIVDQPRQLVGEVASRERSNHWAPFWTSLHELSRVLTPVDLAISL